MRAFAVGSPYCLPPMDPTPPPPPGDPRLPAVRSRGAVVPWEAGRTRPGSGPDQAGQGSHRWRRLTRSRRGAAGLAIVAAALLLWPFAGWFWIPWLAGLVVLVLIGLLRLDRLLGDWAWHVGGLAVVAGLMLRTGPWDWALAASIGVLLAGLVQLPWWRLAAVGAVLCVMSGTGWGMDRVRVAQEGAAQQAQAQAQSYDLNQMSRPTRALPVLLRAVGRNDPTPVCSGLMSEAARASFATAVGTPDCPAAVQALAAKVEDPAAYGLGRAPSSTTGDVLTVDACRLSWAPGVTPGPQLGVFTVGRAGSASTYVVTGFRACSP
jgi:hypothetical protein